MHEASAVINVMQQIFKNPVPASAQTLCLFFIAIIAVYLDSYTKHILCKNVELCNVKTHCA